eukprot:jgi/Galph1/3813/GphlegSOOS_G2445.1
MQESNITESEGQRTQRVTRNLQTLLNWSIEHSTAPQQPSGNEESSSSSGLTLQEQVVLNRKWLDAVIPNDAEAMRKLGEQVGDPNVTHEERAQALGDLETYIEDINNAINMDKVGALQPVLECLEAKHPSEVRSKAFEVVGTALQDSTEVRQTFMNYEQGIPLLVEGLKDSQPKVRAKAVRAVSALLRNFPMAIGPFRAAKGGEELVRMATSDNDRAVRHRVLFFLEHCLESNNEWFAVEIAASPISVACIVDRLRLRQRDQLDQAIDMSELEAIVGALTTLASLSKTATTLYDAGISEVLTELETREMHSDLKEKIVQLRRQLSAAQSAVDNN